MTKRIFGAILLVVGMTFLLFYTLMLRVMFDYLSDYQLSGLKNEIVMLSEGTQQNQLGFLEKVNSSQHIVWISPEGKVLYDNMDADAQGENYSNESVVKEAQKKGESHQVEYAEEFYGDSHYLAKSLDDGSVVCIVSPQRSMWTIKKGLIRPILIIMALIFAVALDYAFQISREIIKPLNELDLDNPLANEEYKEVRPLLTRIDSQQKELHEQEQQSGQRRSEFETILSSMNEGLLLLKPDGTIMAGNRIAFSLLTSEKNDVEGKKIQDITTEPSLATMIDFSSKGEHRSNVIVREDNHYQITTDPVFDNGQEPIGITVTVLNVTEKEAMENLRREFTANVSHELKTPLHTISGSAELLCSGIVKEEDLPNFYHRSYSESQRMISLVEDIMDISESDAKGDGFNQEVVDVYQIAKHSMDNLKDIAKSENNIELSLEGQSANVWADREIILSIVTNLISNAIKYNKENGEVNIRVFEDNKNVVLEVEDTGVGIPAGDQERIFERFYRVDKSRSRQAGGTGLGLSIVRNYVQNLNGVIEVDSEYGKGTTFTVKLPKYDENEKG